MRYDSGNGWDRTCFSDDEEEGSPRNLLARQDGFAARYLQASAWIASGCRGPVLSDWARAVSPVAQAWLVEQHQGQTDVLRQEDRHCH
jgi:hypothetical protein